MTETVMIGFATGGEVTHGFFNSVLGVLLEDAMRPERRFDTSRAHPAYTYCVSGPTIAKARNELATKFLETENEWLWMLDDDMTFDATCLEHLLSVADKDERPLVGGLCFGGGKEVIFPTMYQIVDPAENDGSPVRHVIDWPEGAIVEVDATGAACLLIHRSVLEHLRELNPDSLTTWFHESVYKGLPFGEDWTFCLKARSAGYRIYVNTNAKTGHVKTIELNETLWRTGKTPLVAIGRPVVEEPKVSPLSIVGAPPLNREQRRALVRR